jgi:transcriptional regulator with XRE-family HTH domain
MNPLFGTRFKSARLRSGLSLQDLASRLENKITRQALHRYEKGEVTPNSEMIGRLCEIMGVRPDYFFRDTRIELGALEYRKLQNLSVRDEHRIIEQAREYLSRYLELEEILGLENQFVNPLNDFGTVASLEDVARAAARVREQWGLGNSAVVNLAGFLEDMHIKVVEIDIETHFNGMQTWVNETFLSSHTTRICVVSLIVSALRCFMSWGICYCNLGMSTKSRKKSFVTSLPGQF